MDGIDQLTPATCCRAFFILSALAMLSLRIILPPRALQGVMSYGARTTSHHPRGNSLVEVLTSYGRVPHGWFVHFYLASVAWTALWAQQYVCQGSVMRFVAERQGGGGRVGMDRTAVAWALMGAQGARRLWECVVVMRPGRSPMWLPHWALGMAFYTVMGVTVWIEGSDAILESWQSSQRFEVLTWRNVLGVAIFSFGWSMQMQAHRHLASLKKYTLPEGPWFRWIVCPHYTAECLVYLGIAVVAAPRGALLNGTVLCGVVFAVTNLGLTASGTRIWYAEKFGSDKVAGKWAMIPFVF